LTPDILARNLLLLGDASKLPGRIEAAIWFRHRQGLTSLGHSLWQAKSSKGLGPIGAMSWWFFLTCGRKSESSILGARGIFALAEIMEKVKARELLSNFRDADVYALGVDAASRKRAIGVAPKSSGRSIFPKPAPTSREYSLLRETSIKLVQQDQ